jgi:VIT1/CCC1 family predicted Fe2+/Mn2+ transporter
MSFFPIAYLVVLVGCTILAVRVWYQARSSQDPAQKQLLTRFVLGLGVFWLVALVGYLAGFFSFSG